MGGGEWNMQKENTRPLLGEVCVNNLIRKSVKLGIGTTPNFIKKNGPMLFALQFRIFRRNPANYQIPNILPDSPGIIGMR